MGRRKLRNEPLLDNGSAEKSIKSRRVNSCESILIRAVKDDDQASVRELIRTSKMGIDQVFDNTKDGFYDWCALGAAIGTRNEKMANFLVKQMKANSSVLNKNSRNLLTEAIFKSDYWAAQLLCRLLNANVNILVKAGGFEFYPLHYAMWVDVQNSRSEWNMTKLILTQGADSLQKSCWTIIQDRIVLEKGGKIGDAIEFVKDLKKFYSGKIKGDCFDALMELITEQEVIEALIKSIDKGTEGCHQFLAKLKPKKTFLRSPLVYATSKGRQDLVQVMINCFGLDVNATEESSGMNPLAVALSLGNLDMVNYLVEEVCACVNEQSQLAVNCPDSGTAITVAVHHDDHYSVKLLYDNGANVIDPIYISEERKMSTNLHLALKNMTKSKDEDMFSLLISLGADITAKGWIDIDGHLKYVSPMELALMYKAKKPADNAFWTKVETNLTQLYLNQQIGELEKMSVAEAVANLNEEVQIYEFNHMRLQKKLELWRRVPDQINAIVSNNQKLILKPAYMSPKDIKEAELTFLGRITKAKTLNEELAKLQNNLGYLDRDELEEVRQLNGAWNSLTPSTSICASCGRAPAGVFSFFCETCTEKNTIAGNNYGYEYEYENQSQNVCNPSLTKRVLKVLEKNYDLNRVILAAEKLLEQEKNLKATSGFMCPEELEMFTLKHQNKIREARILEALVQSSRGEILLGQYQEQMSILEKLMVVPKELPAKE